MTRRPEIAAFAALALAGLVWAVVLLTMQPDETPLHSVPNQPSSQPGPPVVVGR